MIAAVLLAAAIPAAAWTDDSPVPGTTRVRAVHLTELGAAVNQRLASCGLPPVPVPAPASRIRAADFNAARASVDAMYSTFGRPVPVWSDGSFLSAGARIRLIHLVELRGAVDASGSWPCPGAAP